MQATSTPQTVAAAEPARACPACLGTRSAAGPVVREFHFRTCLECRTLFVADPPSQADLVDLYADDSYFANPDFGSPETGGYHGYRDYLADRVNIEAKFDQVLAHLERWAVPGRLLDVGAGPGLLLSVAKRRGWEALGLDLNPWAVATAHERFAVDVRVGSLPYPEIETDSCGAVTLVDLLEHLPEPESVVGEASRVTKAGGGLAVLTPDAGSWVSRMLGTRWPEVQRAPEHLTLFSVRGVAALVRRHGYEVRGWHPIGKRSTITTLAADVAPIAPAVGRAVQGAIARSGIGEVAFELDPHTKFCLYAQKLPAGGRRAIPDEPIRLPKKPAARAPEEAVRRDLMKLSNAQNLCDWMYEQLDVPRAARVAEVGAGIGTFSRRILSTDPERLLLLEPDPWSADRLEAEFAELPNVSVSRDEVGAADALTSEDWDLVVCQNVLEHIDDDTAAIRVMARALAPGGRVVLLVPAHPRLYGRLDLAYGHYRRYTKGRLRALADTASLDVARMHYFNAAAAPGWWLSSRGTGRENIRDGSLQAFERLVPALARVEEWRRPPFGLSLVMHAARPGAR